MNSPPNNRLQPPVRCAAHAERAVSPIFSPSILEKRRERLLSLLRRGGRAKTRQAPSDAVARGVEEAFRKRRGALTWPSGDGLPALGTFSPSSQVDAGSGRGPQQGGARPRLR